MKHGPRWIVELSVKYKGYPCFMSRRSYAQGQGGPVYYRSDDGQLHQVPDAYRNKALDNSFSEIELTEA